MGILNSSTAKKKVSETDRAILDLKIQRDKLKQLRNRLTVVLEKEHQAAVKYVKESQADPSLKKLALLALRKKKYQQTLIDKTEEQLNNLETLTFNIENALVQKELLEGIKKGNAVLAKLNKECDIDRVENIMGQLKDEITYQREVEDLMGELSKEDEDLVLAELDALVESEDIKKLDRVSAPETKLPEGKTEEPAEPEKVEERKQEEQLVPAE
ncbi:hypothetical protein MP638_003179 [Amoeboaphelidium occidentale]|nr:hypothetical protein MP638_003179 [Amoeboaphelidium occidentale]